MQSFLARCCLVALLVTGFVCTGDVSRLSRGLGRLVGASDVPHAAAPARESSAVTPPDEQAPEADPLQPTNALLPLGRFDVEDHSDPLASRPIEAPPTNGIARVEIATLAPGTRIHVWIGQGGRWVRRRAVEVIRLDVIDPAAGEVLEYRHCATAASDTPPLPPRRMRLPTGAITRDDDLTRLPVGSIHDQPGGSRMERAGPVLAIVIGPA
ncbi:MAG: hypothetical protein KGQ61_04540 [Planctomycetes bacterium]|nr:hypothetical protein [Planctomycetota bacterium]